MKFCCARYASSLLSPAAGVRSTLATSRTQSGSLRFVPRANMATSNSPYASMPKEQPGDEADDVLFNSLYGVRTIELNRPKKLNSLNGSMARKILPRLREWEKSAMANVIMITGAGPKAFCAGGDVAALAQQNGTAEGQKDSTDYFALEYQLDQLIATYSKPYVAVMDGITMGGGVGLSVHAPFRIATEKTVFAMPETTIGFFPDVGASFFLPRLDGELGTYLALTSEQLHGVQAFNAGVATHYLDSSVLASLTTRLSELVFKDYATLDERLALINSTISEFATEIPSADAYPKAKNGNLTGNLRDAIDRTFKFDTIEEILAALDKETRGNDPRIAEWAAATLKTIALRSPTSVKVTLKMLRAGLDWNISTAFKREHTLAARFMAHPDFVEGVTAKLVRRSTEKPNWQPSEFSEISEAEVSRFFILEAGDEEMKLIEPMPGAQSQTYTKYPHAIYTLPSESVIGQVVRNKGQNGADAVISDVLRQWNNKIGVREKVEDVISRRTRREGKKIVWQDQVKANL